MRAKTITEDGYLGGRKKSNGGRHATVGRVVAIVPNFCLGLENDTRKSQTKTKRTRA